MTNEPIAVVETATLHVWDICPNYTAANAAACNLAVLLGEPFHTRPATRLELAGAGH